MRLILNVPDPLSEAEKKLLDMAGNSWKLGIAALCGWANVLYYRSIRNNQSAT